MQENTQKWSTRAQKVFHIHKYGLTSLRWENRLALLFKRNVTNFPPRRRRGRASGDRWWMGVVRRKKRWRNQQNTSTAFLSPLQYTVLFLWLLLYFPPFLFYPGIFVLALINCFGLGFRFWFTDYVLDHSDLCMDEDLTMRLKISIWL